MVFVVLKIYFNIDLKDKVVIILGSGNVVLYIGYKV